MNSNDENDFNEFSKNKLLQGFGTDELKALYEISKPIPLEKGASLIYEGEKGNELYFITRGTLEVTKHDKDEKNTYVIDTLSSGEVVGEISFIDRGFRSASVRAKTKAQVRSISFDLLEKFVNQSVEYSHVYIHLSKNISQRLRNTSNMALESLKNESRENKTRVRMGMFLVYIITGLCLFAYALSSLQYLVRKAPSSSYIALPLTLLIGASLLILMKLSKLSWSEFGVTLDNWRRSVFEGIVFPIPILGACLFVKWMLTLYDSDYAGQSLFEPFAVIEHPENKTWAFWFAANAIYCFFMVPIQELLTRGALQGLLADFLIGRWRVPLSILASNLVFSTVHVYFSLHTGVIVFLGGIYIGWIYSRTHNLISSMLAHAILGVWFLSVLGESIAIQRI